MVADGPRVMLLAPQYWISGTVTLARELQLGWPTEWPRPLIACPTPSGKASTQWGRDVSAIKRATSTSWVPDISGSAEQILELARESFDLVHVTEPDTQAAKREWWHSLLERLNCPWTITLNGNTYPDVHWDRIIRARNFAGVVWHTPGNVPIELREARRAINIVSLSRPYTLRNMIDDRIPRATHSEYGDKPVVGTHCRIAPSKGIATLAALSKHIGANVCIDGAAQGGSAPYTFALQNKYLTEEQKVPAEATWLAHVQPQINSQQSPGYMYYAGAFSDGVDVARYHSVHVSTTCLGFSAGHEYSVLEAIDSGCVIVQPDHMTELGCPLKQYTYPWERRGIVGALNDEHESLSSAVRDALTAHTSHYDQSCNRALIAQHHDPKLLVASFINEVMSVI